MIQAREREDLFRSISRHEISCTSGCIYIRINSLRNLFVQPCVAESGAKSRERERDETAYLHLDLHLHYERALDLGMIAHNHSEEHVQNNNSISPVSQPFEQ